MATYYVGTGGSDANAGTTYAARKLTLTGVEAVATAAGDTVFVAPGTYREQLTLGASGGNAYSTGTVTVTNGSTTVTGSGTTFTGGNVVAGYYFKTPTGATILISAVNTATELILATAYDGVTTAGASYVTYNPIKWIGDYGGTNTDSVGGVVRITGSGDDITASRTNCIIASTKNYRHFTGFKFDLSSGSEMTLTSPQYWLINKCHFSQTTAAATQTGYLYIDGASQLGVTVDSCFFDSATVSGIHFTHSSTLTAIGHIVQNCTFDGLTSIDGGSQNISGIAITRISGMIFKNNLFRACGACISVLAALSGSTSNSVLNNIFMHQSGTVGVNIGALCGNATTNLVEDYNTFFGCRTNRQNTNTGANSITYPPLFDSRWWFELTS